ncbi:MAG TPA: hypothetical protein VF170_00375 [Planctomycetaceae bacterium]
MDWNALTEQRARVVTAVTRAVDLRPDPSPAQGHGTIHGLLSVAAVIALKLRGVPVTRRRAHAVALAALNAIRDRVDAECRS